MRDGYQYPFIAEGELNVVMKTSVVSVLVCLSCCIQIQTLHAQSTHSHPPPLLPPPPPPHLSSGEPHIDGEPGDLIMIIKTQKCVLHVLWLRFFPIPPPLPFLPSPTPCPCSSPSPSLSPFPSPSPPLHLSPCHSISLPVTPSLSLSVSISLFLPLPLSPSPGTVCLNVVMMTFTPI